MDPQPRSPTSISSFTAGCVKRLMSTTSTTAACDKQLAAGTIRAGERHVHPSLFAARTYTPASINIFTTSSPPKTQAVCRGDTRSHLSYVSLPLHQSRRDTLQGLTTWPDRDLRCAWNHAGQTPRCCRSTSKTGMVSLVSRFSSILSYSCLKNKVVTAYDCTWLPPLLHFRFSCPLHFFIYFLRKMCGPSFKFSL